MLNCSCKIPDMNSQNRTHNIDVVIFDFGGVLADRGFEEGLAAIAARHGFDGAGFHKLAHDLIYSTGYLTGNTEEHAYWQMIRDKTGIRDGDAELRGEILSRFVLRPWMFEIVKKFRAIGVGIAILSDQTNWLDELNRRDDFFKYFDVVFNSYHLGKSKMDPSHFSDTASRLDREPQRLLFVDDSEAHCQRACKTGMKTIHYTDCDLFLKEIEGFCPIAQQRDDTLI
jgi:putative hydrolase of the HAD superfamily